MSGISRWEELQRYAVSRTGGAFLTGILRTCSIRILGEPTFRRFRDAGKPVIFTLWHGRLGPCTYMHRDQGIVALISQHRDGEYIARLVERWGYETARGSSSRGGTGALRQLVRSLREGKSVAITPDGPRGPRERVKPGAVILAQLSGAPLIPLAGAADRGWWFGSWDRFLIPKPFSRVCIAYGEPLLVPRAASPEELEGWVREAEVRIQAVTRRVDSEYEWMRKW